MFKLVPPEFGDLRAERVSFVPPAVEARFSDCELFGGRNKSEFLCAFNGGKFVFGERWKFGEIILHFLL